MTLIPPQLTIGSFNTYCDRTFATCSFAASPSHFFRLGLWSCLPVANAARTVSCNRQHQWYSLQHQWYSLQHRWYSLQHQWYSLQHQRYSLQHQWYSLQYQWYSLQHQRYSLHLEQQWETGLQSSTQTTVEPLHFFHHTLRRVNCLLWCWEHDLQEVQLRVRGIACSEG